MRKHPSNVQRQFESTPSANIQRSRIKRSHGYKTTFDSGYLIPIFVDEALPGDTLNLKMEGFGRLATPLHPFMDNLWVDTFFFAVPERLLWTNWEKFNGAQDNPADSVDFITPKMTSPGGGYAEQSLSDYLGLPTKVAGISHRSAWHRAYNLVYNQWFRDENLQDSIVVDLDDGPDDPADYVLKKRGKRHDYFTASLPWPQKGPSVPLPLTGNAPVRGIAVASTTTYDQVSGTFHESGGNQVTAANVDGQRYDSNEARYIKQSATQTTYPDIYADLTAVTAATINELRQAVTTQQFYERDARGGTRYTEVIRSHFNVISPDARLQRSEFLGGGSSPINVNPIAQTSATDVAVSPQGNLAAMGTLNVKGHGFTKSFTEHCILIGLVSVRADLTYQQGLDRMFSRSTRLDFYWPSFAQIGEQAVLSQEIYADGTADDQTVWGYQERYGEYRNKPSKITGRMRSNATQSLETWHLSQNFASRPLLNNTYIEENPPVDRVIAVTSEPEFLFDAWFDYICARPMPIYGVPGLSRF